MQYELTGMKIHGIQPVKFGGSPTDIANKFPLPTSIYRSEVTPWWNAIERNLED
jgi:filamentous hemagglutinin